MSSFSPVRPCLRLRVQSLLLSSVTVLLFLYLVVFMPYVKGVVPNCTPFPPFLSLPPLPRPGLTQDRL